MTQDHSTPPDAVPHWTEEQRNQIREELNDLLADTAFKHSRRCTLLLRGLVDRALAGDLESIKERSLGVEVFGRAPSYDSNADPIVRMTANEIRKRLAQFYRDPNHQRAVEIRLFPGSYLLEFVFCPTAATAVQPLAPPALPEPHLAQTPEPNQGQQDDATANDAEVGSAQLQSPAPRSSASSPVSLFKSMGRSKILVCAGILFCVLLLLAYSVLSGFHQSAQSAFWKPLLNSKSILICLSDSAMSRTANTAELNQNPAGKSSTDTRQMANVAPGSAPGRTPWFEDINAAHRIAIWLAAQQLPTTLRPSSQLGFWSMRQTPAILVGTMNNQVASRFFVQLRYSIHADEATRITWIEDAQNPSKREWVHNTATRGSAYTDYAIITRVLSSETGTWVVALAGLSSSGTDSASKLLTDPSLDSLLPQQVRNTKNFQMIIKVNEFSGVTSQPQVIAFHSW